MLAQDNIDISQILTPIAGSDNQTGYDIRTQASSAALYYDLKELRLDLRKQQNESLILNTDHQATSQWQKLINDAKKILIEYSKDIEVMCWLVEALVHLDGIDGLTLGISLLNTCLKTYKREIFPSYETSLDPTDIAQLIPLQNLNHKNSAINITTDLNLMPLFIIEEKAITTWDILQAQKKDNDTSLPYTIDTIKTLMQAISCETFNTQKDKFTTAIKTIDMLHETLMRLYGNEAPSLGNIKACVQSCIQTMSSIAPSANKKTTTLEKKAPIQTNKQDEQKNLAKQALISALKYYQQYEPHSPIIYLLKRILCWQTYSLQQIIHDMQLSEDSENEFKKILGIE